MRTSITLSVIPLLLLSWSTGIHADDDKARQLMGKVFNRSLWNDMQGVVSLTLTNPLGQQKNRQLQVQSKKNARDEMKMLMRFTSPADVKDTAFLVIEHKQGEDDRRLYLPALRRVQRISAAGAGGNFMSSDFTFYDIGRPKIEDWNFSFGKGDEKCATVVIGEAARDQVIRDTGYSRIVWCVNARDFMIVSADYYDKDQEHFKTLKARKVEIIGNAPFTTDMLMQNLITKHRSEMVFSQLRTNTGIADSAFNERALRQ